MSTHPEGLREVIDASVERWADLYPTPDVVTHIADDVTAWLAEHDAKVRAKAQAEVLRMAADGLHAGVRGSRCNAACHEADQITLRIRADRIEREAGSK